MTPFLHNLDTILEVVAFWVSICAASYFFKVGRKTAGWISFASIIALPLLVGLIFTSISSGDQLRREQPPAPVVVAIPVEDDIPSAVLPKSEYEVDTSRPPSILPKPDLSVGGATANPINSLTFADKTRIHEIMSLTMHDPNMPTPQIYQELWGLLGKLELDQSSYLFVRLVTDGAATEHQKLFWSDAMTAYTIRKTFKSNVRERLELELVNAGVLTPSDVTTNEDLIGRIADRLPIDTPNGPTIMTEAKIASSLIYFEEAGKRLDQLLTLPEAIKTSVSPTPAATSIIPTPVSIVTPPSKAPVAFPGVRPDAEVSKKVLIRTTLGDIIVQVDPKAGPNAASNFIYLVKQGFYNGTIFHRVIPGFMIQGGDPTGTGRGGPGYQFANDPVTGLYSKGVVAMANAGRDTNGSQFFIMAADYPLGPDYSIFGHVTAGQDVVDKISLTQRDEDDRPLTEVKMIDVKDVGY